MVSLAGAAAATTVCWQAYIAAGIGKPSPLLGSRQFLCSLNTVSTWTRTRYNVQVRQQQTPNPRPSPTASKFPATALGTQLRPYRKGRGPSATRFGGSLLSMHYQMWRGNTRGGGACILWSATPPIPTQRSFSAPQFYGFTCICAYTFVRRTTKFYAVTRTEQNRTELFFTTSKSTYGRLPE